MGLVIYHRPVHGELDISVDLFLFSVYLRLCCEIMSCQSEPCLISRLHCCENSNLCLVLVLKVKPQALLFLDVLVAFSALTLLVGRQEGDPACKKMGGWWRWALVSPDGVVLIRMAGVSATVNLPLHHKVQKFSSGTRSPGWSQKNGRKMVVVVW